MTEHDLTIGVDFGTTNSTVGLARNVGLIELVRFPFRGDLTESFRSILYFDEVHSGTRKQLRSWAGPQAIEEYLNADKKGRLMQSLKSYLPSRSLTGTEVFGRRYSLEDLVARILSDLRQNAEHQYGQEVRSVLAGRPVRFVGAETAEDDAFAVSRLEQAFRAAGFESVEFELEPVAAAYYYESTLDHNELILIGDFGGGTSDFSLLHVGPTIRKRGRTPEDLLGNSGVGIAGDAFDAKLVRKLVSPMLGAGSLERALNKTLPAVPNWVYAKLERWHYLSFLRTKAVLEMLRGARVRAFEPEKIEALLNLIEEDLGYQLHQAVQRVKCELSQEEAAEFRFRDGSLDIHAAVTRGEFEAWIEEELTAVESCVDSLLASTGVGRPDIDKIFLTGGSSFVPAVRHIFTSRFGHDRVVTGDEFTSVARGLALRAREKSSGRA